MLDAIKHYVRRVILLHAVLLLVVVGGMLIAAQAVYDSAREEAIKQESQRIQLLADQTARGIESHYTSILQDLTLILRDENDPTATQTARVVARAPGTPPEGGGGGLAGTRPARPIAERIRARFDPRTFDLGKTVPVTAQNAALMYRQLRGRVQTLFVMDKQDRRTVMVYPSTENESSREIVKQHQEWLDTVTDKPAISDFVALGEGYGYHLIAIPAVGLQPAPPPSAGAPGPPGQRDNAARQLLVVAVVPIEQVKERFLDPVNQRQEGQVNAALVGSSGQILVAMHPEFAGHNLVSELPASAQGAVRRLMNGTNSAVAILPAAELAGGIKLPERIVAAEPIAGIPGREWTILFFAPLSETEKLVWRIFGSAMVWSLVLSASIGAVLISTSTIMIRSRVKVERMRHEVLTRELEQAREIQLAWLPDARHVPAGLEIAAANLPASHISGDFYNWFAVGIEEDASGKTALVIGDVTGHGMAAAFLMSTTQLLVRATLRHYQDPGRCLREVNRQLCTQGFRGQFVTMGVLVVDPASGSVEAASAGHMAPLVARDGGAFEELATESSLVLGVDPVEHFATQGFILGGGATIALYTDGVVEAENAGGEQFGLKRLLEILNASPEAAPEARVEAVMNAVRQFCGTREILDDITLVIIRVR